MAKTNRSKSSESSERKQRKSVAILYFLLQAACKKRKIEINDLIRTFASAKVELNYRMT